ncbi:COMM domain-containing protein 10 isoform X2 [Podarcis raffonei]|uniref:COMM domain-containing protein 10 isoform X2 n=1 Tax=Podarcis raffonei TaxID=65483 RepID=UPI0023292A0B|nr:COMM domain-containing protein 10 isoform X2 [Podarcis raffonei]
MAAPTVIPDTVSVRKAVSLINAIDTGKFSRLLSRILQKLHLKAESTFTEEEEEKLQAAFSVEKQDLHLVLETIAFILEQAVYHNLKPTVLQQQLEHSKVDHDKAEVFATTWAAAGPETVEKFRQRTLSPQKLESVGWQLNLQMAQSTQAKQKSPQAVLELGMSNEDSKYGNQRRKVAVGNFVCCFWPRMFPVQKRQATHRYKKQLVSLATEIL